MEETQYKVIEAGQPKVPPRSLLSISGDRKVVASLKAFGPGTYRENIAEMQKQYSHPQTGEIISFRESRTPESILIAVYDFEHRAKPEIFDPRWLQAGPIFKAPEWVVINPPRDKQGNPITDEQTLKSFLNGLTKVNGIFRIPNGKVEGARDCSYVPYESFAQGVQSGEDFAGSGLARGLEYAEGIKAPNLEIISAKKNYPRGVNVFGFGPEDMVRVTSLGSGGGLDDNRLYVDGDYWDDDYLGYAFGVLD